MAAIIPLILQGLSILPGIIAAFHTIFGKSSATATEKADAITNVAGTVITAVGSVSGGGQKETMDKAAQVLPMFHDLTTALMNLAEASGQPGTAKQQYVSDAVTAAMQGWEKLSTGGQATTVEQIKPVVNAAVDTFVPVLFPEHANITNLQPQ
jgi:hypothetical protein